ncbi:hypothetical protein GIB67_020662 [Kingdonia uniflora]|uniref:Uncharacterized protein n=1 Tax=Kingdonia uniflora TaxID=39325 RepID=A0A7J7M9L5_9MAGN|nr:hypothetical protein GIB67_020662 [Kingdonia uniflora]
MNMENGRPGSSFKKIEYFMCPSNDYSNMKKLDNASNIENDMSDRVYTIDSIHNGLKAPISKCDDYVTTLRDIVNVLEVDMESMKPAIISMRTDKVQLILLKEIAQQQCKDMSPERRLPGRKPSRSFSMISLLKWIMSFVFGSKRAHQSKYMFNVSESNDGLLLLLEDGTDMRRWRWLSYVCAGHGEMARGGRGRGRTVGHGRGGTCRGALVDEPALNQESLGSVSIDQDVPPTPVVSE